MREVPARILERRSLAPNLTLLWLAAPEISRAARPGQFVLALPSAGLDPFLPRPLWIHRLRDGDSGEEMALLVEARGRGTRMLAAHPPGGCIRLTGPCGRATMLTPGARRLLLIGEGVAVAPLVWLADEETARGRSVTLLLVAGPSGLPYPLDLLHAEVEVVVVGVTEGARPLSVPLPDLAAWADQVVVSGGPTLPSQVDEILRPLPFRRPCTALLAPPMPCGAGFCGGCAISLRRRGVRLACVDGPAFNLRDLL